ncbi:MAG: 6,7-dimethyl-8-ribityllumazine synthase [Chloroflexi bacterium]|nr:6,7-dimethyl-8-ribityllumazine synthase [Chloroflexota bacterium]MBI4197862.1 6,7-dimethyl-8-ribityllumazine synthase [Chloroflexota bacterium]
MPQVLKGHQQGDGLRIGIVVARFNEHITSRLLQGALEGLLAHGVLDEDIVVVWVPGSFEIPAVAEQLAQRGDFDAVICLGAVVKHETDHYYYVAAEAARGIASVARESEAPVIFGVLTTENDQQALERAGGKEGNKGLDAALAAIEMVNVLRQVEEIR